MAKGKNVLTTGDVARICNVAPRTVSKWFDSGQLKGYRIPGSKDRRIPLGELIRFMKMHNMPTDAVPMGQMRVLIADSDSDSANTLAESLKEKTDYEVMAVASSFETGLAAEKFSPHVILISLLDSRIGASEICRSIRADEQLQTIKILALANTLNSSEQEALMRNGFDGYINKSAPPEEVIRQIEQATAIIY